MRPRLLETMRVEDGHVALLDLHLARLGASAEAFGYPADVGRVAADVTEAASRTRGVAGLRLTVGSEGDVEIEAWPLDPAPFRTVRIDPDPLWEAGSTLCMHKTTARDHYRVRYNRARRLGADEAVLVNERGEVTEGTRTNVWAQVDGRLWTPPLGAGGLGGVYRAHVLASRPEAEEHPLSPADLLRADALFLSNALRGLMPVRLVGPSDTTLG